MRIRERYEPLEVLGRGAEGAVVRALDHVHSREVAIKIRAADDVAAREAVLREGRVLFDIPPHAALPVLRDDFFDGDRYYLVMDLVRGRRLSDLLAEEGSPGLPFDRAHAIAAEVAAALDHLHGCDPPIVHGDIKPANVLLDTNGRVRIVDFGLTSMSGDGRGGTSAYAAPEAVYGTGLSPASDVFSFAAMIHQLLSGAVPEPGARADWTGVPDALHELVKDALESGLQTDPGRRPRTASDLVQAMLPPLTPNNLPASLSSFVGREDELLVLRGVLARTRFLTLTGAGGSGKTRLAIELARTQLWRYGDGVHLVDLDPHRDLVGVVEAVAAELAVPPSPGRARIDAVKAALASGPRLLVLDTCEHLADDAAEFVTTALGAAPELTILATSRTRLRVEGEHLFRVPSLAVPSPGDSVEAGRRVASARLILERADAAGAGPLSKRDVADVVEIARQLDGIPLALELAAGAMRNRSPRAVLRSLDEEFADLATGTRRLERHETLRKTIDWGLGHVSGHARKLLARVSVFAGTWSIDAAEAICSSEPLESDGIARLVAELADASLIEPVAYPPTRYRLLDTVRAQGRHELSVDGAHRRMFDRHAQWVEEIVSTAMAQAQYPTLDLEVDEIRAALGFLADTEPVRGALLFIRIGQYFDAKARWSELLSWADRFLGSELPAATDLQVRNHAVTCAGRLGQFSRASELVAGGLSRMPSGDLGVDGGFQAADAQSLLFQRDIVGARAKAVEAVDNLRAAGTETSLMTTLLTVAAIEASLGQLIDARTHLEESVEIAERLAVPRVLVAALVNLGGVFIEMDNFDEAERIYARARELALQLEDTGLLAIILGNLATIRDERNDLEGARAAFEESLELRIEMGDDRGRAQGLCDLAGADERLGDLDASDRGYAASLELCVELGDNVGQALAHAGLANVRRLRGDFAAAEAAARNALDLVVGSAHVSALAICLDRWASVLESLGEVALACRAVGAADGVRRPAGLTRPAALVEAVQELLPGASDEESADDVVALLLDRADRAAPDGLGGEPTESSVVRG